MNPAMAIRERLHDTARWLSRHWSVAPALAKTAVAVVTECRTDRAGLNVAWNSDTAGQELQLVVGPFAVSVHTPPWPGADDDFGQFASVDVAGHSLMWYWTQNFIGVDSTWAKRDGQLSFHGKAGPLGFVVEPIEQVK